jgi:acetyl-CoA C-acetyltransferase
MTETVVIVAAKRTAIGNLCGALSSLPAHKLGEAVIKQIIIDASIKNEEISEVILGQILTGGAGQNPARQASIGAGLSIETPAWLVNQVCGSGLKSVILGYNSIITGQSKIVIAGGQESMSQAPHGANIRFGQKSGNLELVDLMLKDGLTDAFSTSYMGITTENIAEKFNINRNDQDTFALNSQNKAESAQKAGKFNDEIVPIKIQGRKEEILVDKDEFIRHGLKLEDITKLKPAFKKDGTVTAGNSSGINDGAAMVLMMTLSEAKKRGLEVLGIIRGFAQAGVEPQIMGTGPIPASRKALEISGWNISDLDLIEANEAFAAQAYCVNKELGWDTTKVNVNGGAIALGHPIGASGTRILVTLLLEMKRRNSKKGIATLCVGGGMGLAMCIERP